jgi:hypothetical protein
MHILFLPPIKKYKKGLLENMASFSSFPLELFHYLIKKLCPWNGASNWLETRELVNTILPLRLVNKDWQRGIDTCYYYWNFMRFTTPVLNQMVVVPSKETILQFLKRRKLLIKELVKTM